MCYVQSFMCMCVCRQMCASTELKTGSRVLQLQNFIVDINTSINISIIGFPKVHGKCVLGRIYAQISKCLYQSKHLLIHLTWTFWGTLASITLKLTVQYWNYWHWKTSPLILSSLWKTIITGWDSSRIRALSVLYLWVLPEPQWPHL